MQPHSVAEASPRIMQIRFMVLRPFAGRTGRLFTSFRSPVDFKFDRHSPGHNPRKSHKRNGCVLSDGVCLPSPPPLFSYFFAVTASIAGIMNNSHFPEFFMPAIRQMLIVCFACVWTASSMAQEASNTSDIQSMRYAAKELKIEFRPSMAQEEQLREQLMSTPLPLTIREGYIDAGEQNRWSLLPAF